MSLEDLRPERPSRVTSAVEPSMSVNSRAIAPVGGTSGPVITAQSIRLRPPGPAAHAAEQTGGER